MQALPGINSTPAIIIEEAIHAAVSMVSINMPVKIICLAEGALTGFTDEIFDLPHKLAAKDLFIDVSMLCPNKAMWADWD